MVIPVVFYPFNFSSSAINIPKSKSKNHTQRKVQHITYLSSNQDVFVASKQISFGNAEYKRPDAELFIDKIISKDISTDTRGFSGEFFRFGDNYGIKVINPISMLDNNMQENAKIGATNVREFHILDKIKEINPEIAPYPIDLIEKNKKYYLVMNFINGVHPTPDNKITDAQMKNIIKTAYELDINGITHCDLQSGNIMLIPSSDKVKFIDFGAYELLTNKGDYFSSDEISVREILNSEAKRINDSPKEGKFLATFYNNTAKNYYPMYSDNPYLKIKSNITNFEYRFIYDYLKDEKIKNKKEIFVSYLKNKGENYHKPLAEFLQNLVISPLDKTQLEQRDNALNTEKLFRRVFANPSDNIIKAEIEKIQLKWLINDYQGATTKAFSAFETMLKNIDKYCQNTSEDEKLYFNIMKKQITPYREFLNSSKFKGDIIEDNKNLLEMIFNEKTKNEKKQTLNIPQQINKVTSKKSNKFMWIAASVATTIISAVILWYYKYGSNAKVRK